MYFIFFSSFVTPGHLSLFDRCALLRSELLSLGAVFRMRFGAEILCLEQLSNLDLGLLPGHGIRTPLDPFNRLLQRVAFPYPEAGDQLSGLGERPIDHGSLLAVKLDPCSLRACLEPV